MTEVPDLLQAGIPRDGLQCTEHLKYMGTTCGGAVVLNDLEEFGLFEADEKTVSRQMPRSQMSWKTRDLKSGLEPTALADRKIALYRLSLNYKTDGLLVNFRRKPFQSTQKTTADKWTFEGMPIVWRWSTLQHFQDSVLGRVRRPTAVQARSHLNTQLPNADTIHFFWSEKKGGSSAPSEPPFGYVPADTCRVFFISSKTSTTASSKQSLPQASTWLP